MQGWASPVIVIQYRTRGAMTTHCLPASVDTCHWGQFDQNLRAVLTVQCGDTLIVGTGSQGTAPTAFRQPVRTGRQPGGHSRLARPAEPVDISSDSATRRA